MNKSNIHLHPLASRHMGGWADDLWSDITDAAKTQANQIIAKAPAQIASAAAGAVAGNKTVQQVAAEQAQQAAINKTAQELNSLKSQLAAEYAALTSNPTGWIKANPGKVAMVGGVVLALIGGTYFMLRGMRK